MKTNTILWADDDVDDLTLIKEILQKHQQSFNIVEAANGKEAIEYLKDAKATGELPCLVILDINMPIMDGKETLSIIKQSTESNEVPVVVFTTSNSELDKLYCRKMKVEMITKPPSYSSLELALMKLLQFASSNHPAG
jgi:CheY-like chemotaxis protein